MKLKVPTGEPPPPPPPPPVRPGVLVAEADLEPAQIQNLGDIMPQFLDVKAKSKQPIRFHIRIEIGNGIDMPSAEVAKIINGLLAEVKDGFQVR